MISPISSIQSISAPDSETGASKVADKMGKDDFLKILLAQIQYQDPLNPMEGTEFTAQLAQFSSLEQLFNVNDNLESIKNVSGSTTRYEVLQFIDKEIVAKGNKISLGQEGTGSGAFQIGGYASCTVQIMDGSGNLLRNIPLGILGAGQHHFEWDGLNQIGSRMTAGNYSFEVYAEDAAGIPVLSNTMITGKVTRVNLEGTSPILYVGNIALDMSDVLEISIPAEGAGESVEAVAGEEMS